MAKTKALISFAVTAKLICVFVFAYAKSPFSHDAAHIVAQPRPSIYSYFTLKLIKYATIFAPVQMTIFR